MYIVYKLTNKVNNKIYFGYTKQSLNKRFYGHYKEPRNTIISRSIRKHGPDNFAKEVVLECTNESDAKFIETFLIYRYETNVIKFPYGNGMNMTDGGEGSSGYKHSLTQRQRWSQERKGKTYTPSYTEITNPRNKIVYQFTTNGTFVNSYPSAKIAGRKTNNDSSNISRCCRSQIKTCGGFIFQYSPTYIKRDISKTPTKMLGDKNPNSKTMYLFNNQLKLINQFRSAGEFARLVNIPYNTIINILNTNNKEIMLNEKSHYISFLPTHSLMKRKDPDKGYKVLQVDLNDQLVSIFPSVNEASTQTGIKRANIHSCLCGTCKTTGGFKWKKLAT